jgi:hypothetical protein
MWVNFRPKAERLAAAMCTVHFCPWVICFYFGEKNTLTPLWLRQMFLLNTYFFDRFTPKFIKMARTAKYYDARKVLN